MSSVQEILQGLREFLTKFKLETPGDDAVFRFQYDDGMFNFVMSEEITCYTKYEFTNVWLDKIPQPVFSHHVTKYNMRFSKPDIFCSPLWFFELSKHNFYFTFLNSLPDYDFNKARLLLSGDVESNPGPVSSKLCPTIADYLPASFCVKRSPNILLSDKIDLILTNEILDILHLYGEDVFSSYFSYISDFNISISCLPFDLQFSVLKKMKMFAINDMESFSKSFNFVLDLYVFRDCSIKTRANKLRANKKLIKNFDLLRSCIDYRPLDTGNEQMFGLDDFMTNMTTQVGETASSVSSMAQQIESTAQFVRVATPRFVNAADSVSSFADIVPKLTETLESITKLSNSSTDTLSKMKPLIDQAVNKIDPVKNVFDNLKKNWLAITACITQISSAKSILDLSCSLVIILNLLGLDTTVVEKIKSFFNSRVQEQEGFKSSKMLMLFLFSFLGKYSPLQVISNFTKNVSQSSKDIESLDKMYELLADVLAEFGFDITSKAKNISGLRKELEEVLIKTARFETLVATRTAIFCRIGPYREFMECYNKLDSIRTRINSNAYAPIRNSNFGQDLMSLVNRYVKMKQLIETTRNTQGRRTETSAILLLGEKGIGKSQLLTSLPSLIYRHWLKTIANNPDATEQELEDSEFMRVILNGPCWDQNASDEYHQGYCGQGYHRCDDMFRTTSQEDHVDLLNFMSCNNYATRQAELSQKGFAYQAFSFIGSSNTFPLTSKKVNNIEALHRRFKVIKVTLREDMAAPKEGFDESFNWLEFTITDGDKYFDHTAERKPVTLEEICEIHLRDMMIKYRRFLEAFEFDQCEEQAAITLNPLSPKNIYLQEDFRTTTQNMMTATKQQRNFAKVIRASRVDYEGRKVPIHELGTLDSSLNASINIFPYIQKSVYTGALDTDVNILCLQPNGSIHCFNLKNKTLDVVANIEDFSHMSFGVEEHLVDFEPEGPVYERFFAMLIKKYIAFAPFLQMVGRVGHLVGWVINPAFEAIISLISYAFVLFTKTSYYESLPNIGFYFEMFYSLSGVANYIPLILTILGLIYYKFKSFKMTSTCNRCEQSIASRYNDFAKVFCTHFCKGFQNAHAKECDELPFYMSYMLREDCISCKNDTCGGDCCHNMPEGDVDYKKIAYYKYWFELACAEEVFVETPKVRRSGHNSWRSSTNWRQNEEESPTGLKQSKVRRTFEEESPSGLKQTKVRHTFKEEESPSGVKQVKTRRSFEEESPSGLKQTKTRRTFEEQAPKDIKERKIINITPNSFEEFMNDYVEEYSYGGHNPGAAKKEQLNIAFEIGNEQLTEDAAARDIYVALAKASVRCYRVDKNGDKGGFLYGHGFQNYIVTPAHLYPRTPIACTFCFSYEGKSIPMKLTNFDRKRDVAVWQFDSNFGFTFSNRYLNNLISEKDYMQLAKKSAVALQHLPQSNILQVVNSEVIVHPTLYLNGGLVQDYEKLFLIKTATTFPPLTTGGDCGGIIVLYDTNYTRKIIGFHVVGTANHAYSAITTRELIEKLMIPMGSEEQNQYYLVDQPYSKYPIVDLLDQVKTEISGCISKNLPSGDFHYIGELEYLAKPAANTSIKKHPFYGSFKETSKPANLSVSDVENPELLMKDANGEPNLLISRTSKYGKFFKNKVDPNILKSMQEQMIVYYSDNFKGVDLSASTEDEILNGQEHDPNSHPLDMRTSPGVPWGGNGQGMGRKKDFYCKMVESVDSLGKTVLKRELDLSKSAVKDFVNCISETDRLAKRGVRSLSIIKDCLKDECRPLDKVHKPRVFKAFPMDKVYLLRKYTLKFKTEWTRLREKMFHAVGINVMSPEWTSLYHLLKSKSNFGGDADFGTFDGNLRAEFMQMAVEIIIATIMENITVEQLLAEGCSREEYELALRVLLDENICTISVSGKTVYMDSHGNPSGSPLTTILNCIVNMLYHWYCFILITGFMSLGKFLQLVVIICFGDDVIYAADPTTGFTFENISKIMIEILEQDYTDAHKETGGTTKLIEDLSFLKRSFKVVSNSMILAPIVKESIEQRFTYTQIEPTDYKTHCENIEEGLIEAAMHTTEYFKKFSEGIRRGIQNSHFRRISMFSGYTYNTFDDYYKIVQQRYLG